MTYREYMAWQNLGRTVADMTPEQKASAAVIMSAYAVAAATRTPRKSLGERLWNLI